MWFFGRSKDNVVQKYTEDLSHLASRIKALEAHLQAVDHSRHQVQWHLNVYGLSLLILGLSYRYITMQPTPIHRREFIHVAVVSIFCFVMANILIYKVFNMYKSWQMRKLTKLRGLYERKLNSLKEETHFHATSSLLQRFATGNDAMVELDDELSAKYKELESLKQELQKNKTKEDRDAWFDKVIAVLAGGDDLLLKVKCPQCHKFNGLYRYANKPISYKCADCGHTTNEESTEDDTGVKAAQPAKKDQNTRAKINRNDIK